MSAFITPRTRLLTLPSGESITVRERLTHGERTASYARMSTLTPDGKRVVDALKSGDAIIIAYLVDWTFADDSGAVVSIRGLPADDLQSVLDNMDHEAVLAIKTAIEAHEEAMLREKKTDGASRSVETSLSLA